MQRPNCQAHAAERDSAYRAPGGTRCDSPNRKDLWQALAPPNNGLSPFSRPRRSLPFTHSGSIRGLSAQQSASRRRQRPKNNAATLRSCSREPPSFELHGQTHHHGKPAQLFRARRVMLTLKQSACTSPASATCVWSVARASSTNTRACQRNPHTNPIHIQKCFVGPRFSSPANRAKPTVRIPPQPFLRGLVLAEF